MKTIIVYASQYGATEKCAKILAEALEGSADIYALTGKNTPDLHAYERVIVGGSIRVGNVLKPVKTFCAEQQAALLQKQLGLFVCCGLPANGAGFVEQNYSQALRKHAKASAVLEGEFTMEKMGFFAKKVVQAVSKNGKNPPPHIDEEAVRAFAKKMDA